MLLGGLWHGASWTSVAWGAYHGALLVGYRLVRPAWDGFPVGLRRAGMFFLVLLGWVPFRAESWSAVRTMLGTMFSWTAAATPPGTLGLLLITAVAALVAHWARNTWEIDHRWPALQGAGLALLFAASLLVIYAGQRTPFLYFQF